MIKLNKDMYNFGRLDFPNQHVSYAEKQEVDWYAKCCDYVIEAGIACKADFNVEEKFNILLGNIPREYYRKLLILIMRKMKILLVFQLLCVIMI